MRSLAITLALAFGCGTNADGPPAVPVQPTHESVSGGPASASSTVSAHAAATDKLAATNVAPDQTLPPRDYLLESVTGTELFRKTPTALSFGDKGVRFSAGCNGHYGKYRVEAS